MSQRVTVSLKKFQSNCSELEQAVYEKTGDDKTLTENVNPDNNKVLGVNWNKFSDEFIFNFEDIADKFAKATTKRNIVHCLASIYDPIGLITPLL